MGHIVAHLLLVDILYVHCVPSILGKNIRVLPPSRVKNTMGQTTVLRLCIGQRVVSVVIVSHFFGA